MLGYVIVYAAAVKSWSECLPFGRFKKLGNKAHRSFVGLKRDRRVNFVVKRNLKPPVLKSISHQFLNKPNLTCVHDYTACLHLNVKDTTEAH